MNNLILPVLVSRSYQVCKPQHPVAYKWLSSVSTWRYICNSGSGHGLLSVSSVRLTFCGRSYQLPLWKGVEDDSLLTLSGFYRLWLTCECAPVLRQGSRRTFNWLSSHQRYLQGENVYFFDSTSLPDSHLLIKVIEPQKVIEPILMYQSSTVLVLSLCLVP